MSFSLIADTSQNSALSPVTTGAIDTSGATGLFGQFGGGDIADATFTFTDSKSNTWTNLTKNRADSAASALAYVSSGTPVVGSGHTMTFDHQGNFMTGAVIFAAFSGVLTGANPLNAESSGGYTPNGTTVQPGSLSPAGTDLFITGAHDGFGATFSSIGSSFSKNEENDTSAHHAAMAWKESASAENPTWTTSGTDEIYAVMASFKAAAAAAASVSTLLMMGV